MKEIPVRYGKTALVDDEDYAKLSCLVWRFDGSIVYEIGRHGVPMHRHIMGGKPGYEIDHIDRNGLNNQKSNFRWATRQQNAINRGIQINNTSGYKGVSLIKKTGKWRAAIRVNGRTIVLGNHLSKEEAALAYNNAARVHFGEFAALNSVP